ncbi:MAG: ATP-dependent zinc metalloprotease FtsH, partial [Oscillospiraceae bacterium]|nr:ATP-dependent zinc metalloprotease FtsH [Oscillospiraceae bacterium]
MNIGPDRNRARQIAFYALVAVLLIAAIWAMSRGTNSRPLKYSEVIELFESNQVEKFSIDTDGNLMMELKEEYKGSKTYSYRVGAFSIFYSDLNETIRAQKEAGTLTEYDYPPAQEIAWWVAFIPYIVIFLMMGVLWYAMMRSAQGGGAGGVMKFSKARTRLGSEERNKKTFADVAGADEEKEELQEIVEYLKDPKAYSDMGARIPKGVLLVGPPGT